VRFDSRKTSRVQARQRVYHPASRLANRARADEAVYGGAETGRGSPPLAGLGSRVGFLTSPVRSIYTPVQEFIGLKPRPHTYPITRYKPAAIVDLSSRRDRERLSASALKAF